MPRPRREASQTAPAAPHGGTARGAQRRQQLVDAAAAILESAGFEAVSHRTVAARAGLPLAATTYYFSALDDLVEAAMRQLGAGYLEQARALTAGLPAAPLPPEAVARLLVALVAQNGVQVDPARLLTFYERYVQAGRHPRLRPMVRAWTAELARLASVVLDRYGYPNDDELPRLVIATIDGLLLDALIDGDARAPSLAAAAVARLLRRLARRV